MFAAPEDGGLFAAPDRRQRNDLHLDDSVTSLALFQRRGPVKLACASVRE
jgi:hypothetical protein